MSNYGKKFLFVSLLTWGLQSAATEPKKWIASMSEVSANLAPSQYVVSAITGSSQVIETESDLAFPIAKLYTFKLCLTHPTDKTPYKGATLSIEGSSVSLKPQILDDACISWTENINYHYTSPARYVTLRRTLNINKIPIIESIPFQFAINPWLHGESSSANEIADFIKIKPRKPVPPSAARAVLSGKDKKNPEVPLIANDSRVNFQELGIDSKTGGRFLFDFRANPQIEVYNSAGQPIYVKLSQGEFEFEAYLLSTLFEGETQIRRIVNQQPLKGMAHLRDGALAFLQEIALPSIPSRGRLELAVVLKPKQDRPFIRIFKGIYILGDYTDLKSNLYARPKTGFTNANKDFNFEDYVGLNKPKDQTYATTTTDGMRQLKYEFEPLMFKLTRVGEETATSRQVYYQVKACVRNGTDNTPLRGYHFTITKAQTDSQNDLTPSIRTSEYDSCIYWDDRIDHKFYAPQRYFKAEYRIQNKELRLDETLTAYVNPWDIILSRDSRTIEPEEINREFQSAKNPAQLFIPSYKIQTRTITYGVDELLRLRINKQVHLILEPTVLNYSHISKGIDSRDSIRDGIWKVRWAVLHNRYESKENILNVLSCGEFLTVATQGRIVAPVTIDFNDFRYIDSRNYLMLEIAPVNQDAIVADTTLGLIPKDPNRNFATTVDNESGLKPQTFIGPLIAGSDEEVGYLVPTPQNPALANFLPETERAKLLQSDTVAFEKNLPNWDAIPATPKVEATVSKETLSQWFNNIYLNSNSIRSWNLDEPTERIALRRSMGPSAYTLKNFSEGYKRDLFMTDLLVRAMQRHELTAELEDRLCFYFFDQNPQQPVVFKSKLLPWRRSDRWLKACLRAVGQPEKSFFRAQLETPVDSITDVQYVGSTSSSLSVGASFSVASSESTSTSNSVSASTQLGVSLKLTDLISLGGSTSYSVSRSESQGQAAGNSLSLSNGVALNIRKLILNIAGTHSQQCLTAELNPSLYYNGESALFYDLKDAVNNVTHLTQFLTQKVRLCFTDEPVKKFRVQENFYFVTQDTSSVGFLDSPDLRNRPLLLQLRGQTTYENFLKIINARYTAPQQTNTMDMQNATLDDRASRALQLAVPSFPGILVETLNRY